MTKLKLIPRHQRGGFVVPNNADLKALLAADWKNKLDYMRLAQQEYTPKVTDPAFVHFYKQTPAQPTVPQQQVVQQPVPAAKRNVQIPADTLAGIQFKAPVIPLLGTDDTQPELTAKQGGNQRTDLQNYFGNRAANGEINRALHGRNFIR
jgi:hypothetical protein